MTDKPSLAGKYAIVTGSTQGLGEAIARLFVERAAARNRYHRRRKTKGVQIEICNSWRNKFRTPVTILYEEI